MKSGYIAGLTSSWVLAIAIAGLIACAAGCDGGKSADSFRCKTGKLQDGSMMCIDYGSAEKAGEWKLGCRGPLRGEWSEGTCDATGALGGCRIEHATFWYFPSNKHKDMADVEAACENGEVVAAP